MNLTRINHRRAGLTLTDVAITIVILLVLLVFLLPSVQRAREPARRTQCRNNLKQIGHALSSYYETFGCFPAGYSLPANGRYTGWGWGAQLVPILGKNSNTSNPVFEKLDFADGLGATQNQFPSTVLAFRCPTDPSPGNWQEVAFVSKDVSDGEVVPATAASVCEYSRSTYYGVVGYLPAELGGLERTSSGESQDNPGRLGNSGTSFRSMARYCDQRNFRGVFGQNSTVRMRDIKDGSSNVLMVGERSSPRNVGLGSIGHGTWLGVPDCSTSVGLAAALGDTSTKLNLGSIQRDETTGFSSGHTRGAHFLMVDGSVRFLNDTISITTYRDLSTIDDGRQVGEF